MSRSTCRPSTCSNVGYFCRAKTPTARCHKQLYRRSPHNFIRPSCICRWVHVLDSFLPPSPIPRTSFVDACNFRAVPGVEDPTTFPSIETHGIVSRKRFESKVSPRCTRVSFHASSRWSHRWPSHSLRMNSYELIGILTRRKSAKHHQLVEERMRR